MRTLLSIIGVFLFVTHSRFVAAAHSENMLAYAEVLRAQGQLIQSIAEGRVREAQSQLIQAEAQKNRVKTQFLLQALNQYRIELRKANAARHNLESKATAVEGHLRHFMVLLSGFNSHTLWSSYRYLVMHVIPISDRLKAEGQTIPLEGRTQDNFQNATFDFSGETVGELFEWLERTQFRPRTSQPGFRAMAAAMDLMTESGKKALDEIQTAAQNLNPESKTLWQPKDIINIVNGSPIFAPPPSGFLPPLPPM